MTINKIALALLFVSAMADRECAPESPMGSVSNFSVEFAGGAATMGGSPYSTTPNPHFPEQQWDNTNVEFKFENAVAGTTNATLQVDTPVGYVANWNKMNPSPNRLGFAGQVNFVYTAVQGYFAGGVYAGIGYNGAHSSSTVVSVLNKDVVENVLDINAVAGASDSQPHSFSLPYNYNDPYSNDMDKYRDFIDSQDVLYGYYNSYTTPRTVRALQNRANGFANPPMAKATVSSGLMFNAGTRIGAMIGNVFPHLRLGWAAYQLKAHMTKQMPAGHVNKADIYGAVQGFDCSATVNNGGVLVESGGDKQKTTFQMGATQRFGNIDGLYNMPSLIKISSKGSRWTNALTLGAGVDWAFQRMTFGFYYQAAICQRVTFDKWSKDVSSGLESSIVTWPSSVTEQKILENEKPIVLNGGSVVNTYNKAVPKLSISPVIHTVMFSAKYVLSKA